jgi:hypothetical protein
MAAAHANDAPRRAESASGAAAADEDAVAQDKAFFSFPYDPYAIQLQLMQQLYATIDSQHVGIFESPTGTVRELRLQDDVLPRCALLHGRAELIAISVCALCLYALLCILSGEIDQSNLWRTVVVDEAHGRVRTAPCSIGP